MATDTESPAQRVGLFLNLASERRGEFQSACGELFHRLLLAESFDAAIVTLGRQPVDLLVIDLDGFEDHGDLASAGALVRARMGKPVLVMCPYDKTSWLPELMTAGPLAYRVSPILSNEMQQAVSYALTEPLDAAATAQQQLLDKEKELRDLLAVQRNVQRALTGMDELPLMASQICVALCTFPGVRHAALFHMKERGNLVLEAQESRNHLDMAQLLGRTDQLLQLPCNVTFPPLLSVGTGELVLMDAPEKAGDPMLAMGLHDHGVRTMLALPLRSEAGGPVLGAVSLMFDRLIHPSREQFSCFGSLAQFISFGLAMSELKHQNDALAGQLTQITTTDALTGAVNRRHGEAQLDNEIRRARRYGIPLGVIAFDIDNFRSVNDIYGYPCGDKALRTVAATVQDRLRTSDTLVRMRGEEFLIIATHTAAIDALKLAEKLRETIANTELPGCDNVTISLGVAQAGPEEGAETLLERLDAALHRAKRAGRNCVELAMAQ